MKRLLDVAGSLALPLATGFFVAAGLSVVYFLIYISAVALLAR
jgi:hypothetical protein